MSHRHIHRSDHHNDKPDIARAGVDTALMILKLHVQPEHEATARYDLGMRVMQDVAVKGKFVGRQTLYAST